MLQINDIVKRQKHSKVLYKVVGFDYPLPLMGGGIEVIIKKVGKKAQTTRVDISRLYNEDGTKIKDKENTMKAQIPKYSTICKKYDCTHFIIWEYQKGYKLESCKMVGQSETVDTIPQDCPYFKEMEELKNKK